MASLLLNKKQFLKKEKKMAQYEKLGKLLWCVSGVISVLFYITVFSLKTISYSLQFWLVFLYFAKMTISLIQGKLSTEEKLTEDKIEITEKK